MFNKKFTLTAICLVMALAACSNTQEADREGSRTTAPPTYESSSLPQTPEVSDFGNYPIIINEVGITDNFYSADGDIPTHVPLHVADILGLHVISAGSQIAIQQNGETLAELSVLNYLAFGEDRVDVNQNDTFMADDNYYFTIYVPISLFSEIGFTTYFANGHVHIYNSIRSFLFRTQEELN